MAEKCELCGEKIEQTFLGKIKGTIIKTVDIDSKKTTLHYVCSECQRKHGKNLRKEIKKKIGENK